MQQCGFSERETMLHIRSALQKKGDITDVRLIKHRMGENWTYSIKFYSISSAYDDFDEDTEGTTPRTHGWFRDGIHTEDANHIYYFYARDFMEEFDQGSGMPRCREHPRFHAHRPLSERLEDEPIVVDSDEAGEA